MIFDSLNAGKTLENQPIQVYKSEVKSAKHIYLVAGLQGDSYESIFVLDKLFHWLNHEHTMEDLPLIVIPILNVDGYIRQTKENARDCDLNTNFPTEVTSDFTKSQSFLSEPETQFMSYLFKKYRPGLILNFMTHAQPTITYEGDAQNVANFISKLNSYPTKTEKIFDRGTLCHYGWHYFHAPVVNILFPKMHDELSLEEIWKHNEICLKKLFLSEVLQKFV